MERARRGHVLALRLSLMHDSSIGEALIRFRIIHDHGLGTALSSCAARR